MISKEKYPNKWKHYSLNNIGKIITGSTPPTKNPDYYGDNYLFISPGDLGEIKYIKNSEKKISKLGLQVSRSISKNSIMVVCIGATIGKVGIAYELSTTNQQINTIIPNNNVEPEYVYYYLIYMSKYLKNYANQSPVPIIIKTDFGKIRIPVPPLVEQRGIVEVLGTVDECIRLSDTVIERAEELKRGLMQQLLTRGIGHTEYKETLLGKIPKTWSEVTIGKLLEQKIIQKIQDGNHGGSHPKASEFLEKGIPFIMANNIVNGKLDFFSSNYLRKERTDKLRIGFSKEGDVLLTHKGSIGSTAIVPKLSWEYIMLTPQVTYYRLNWKKLDRCFLYYVFQSDYFQKQLRRYSKQSTRDYVSLKTQKTMKVLVPNNISEQKEIARILSIIDYKIDIERKKQGFLNFVKQGLMQVLLSGKIRVELREDGVHRIRDGREAHH